MSRPGAFGLLTEGALRFGFVFYLEFKIIHNQKHFKTMMLQTHSQSETLAHIHWHMFLYLHVGWAPCRLSSLSLTTSGPDHESIHVRLTHMFCGGFSKSEPAHLMCDLASTAIQIQKRPMSMSHHGQGGCKSFGTVTCFLGMGFSLDLIDHFKLSILNELMILF